jgi:CMP-N,N'-diacetyllegionaminic acid synthase
VIDVRQVLAVVPARGGSKGLPRKNLLPLCGTPLVALAGEIARQVPEIDRAVVSTDSPEIAAVAQASGLAAPFLRPDRLSGDTIGDVDVLLHALHEMETLDRCTYDVVVMLQPTSPLRTVSDVRACLEMFAAKDADAVWSVSAADKKYHPLKQLRVEHGALSYYDQRGKDVIARQQLEELYFRNGVAYVLSRECLVEQRSLLGEKTFAYVTPGPHINIDTAEDFADAERFLKEKTIGHAPR